MKRIVHYLQHRAENIGSDTDADQEEIICLRHNLLHNNYIECIISASRNLDRKIKDDTRKPTLVCLL